MACYDTGHFHFKLNLNITQLEYIVDWVMVPLNRDFPSATTFSFVGRPWFGPLTCLWSVPPTREGYGRAYPGPVSRHNLVCPCLRFLVAVSMREVLATTVVGVSLVDTGPSRTSLLGIGLVWPGECHGNGRVFSECRWSTQMGVRSHGFHGVGTVCYLCSVYNLSIAESTVTDTS